MGTLCAIVGKGSMFHDPEEVTFPDDEAARHKVIDLTGDLALLCESGHGGLPVGHFVAWNADHALQLKFCVHLWNEVLSSGELPILYKRPLLKLKSLTSSYRSEAKVNLQTGKVLDYAEDNIGENSNRYNWLTDENDTSAG